MDNPYVTLGVSEGATPEVIRIAYEGRLKALGRAGLAAGERKAEERQLREAYKVLSDPRRRAAYDEQLAGRVEGAEARSRKAKVALAAGLAVAVLGGLGWYLADRSQRLEEVRREEARLEREAAEAQRRAAAEKAARERRELEAAGAQHADEKRAEAERQRLAREQHQFAVEQARAKAQAEARARAEAFERERQERERRVGGR